MHLNPIAIKVESIGKKYQINRSGPYLALRDVIVNKINKRNKRRNNINNQSWFWALKDISFEISKGEVVGIIGSNGAGKSTLLKIISRITEPTYGRVTLWGRVASLLEVGTGFHPELTGRENIYLSGTILGMKHYEVQQKFDEIIDFAGVEMFIDTPVKHYSSGMRVRLGFAVAANLNSDILLIDEVLAVGDNNFQKKCLDKISTVGQNGKTILLVSHNTSFVEMLCNKAILLKKGTMVNFDSTSIIVNQYLSQKSTKVAAFNNKPIKQVQVNILNGKISILALYSLKGLTNIKFPHLGFVIHNHLGQPIFGNNPSLQYDNIYFDKLAFPHSGRIIIDINNIQLLDGEYILSFWFGVTPRVDIQIEKECLKFQVSGMAILKGKVSPLKIGNVYSNCTYRFLDSAGTEIKKYGP